VALRARSAFIADTTLRCPTSATLAVGRRRCGWRDHRPEISAISVEKSPAARRLRPRHEPDGL